MEEETSSKQAQPPPDDYDDAAKRQQSEIMSLYAELNKEDSDGLDFVGSTSQAIAYERSLESDRDDRLFNDHLAKHFVGNKGQKCSLMINKHLGISMGIENIHIGYTAARTKLVNDKLEEWINRQILNDAATTNTTKKPQVVNLGAGVDTRAFWLEPLKNVSSYIEVDTHGVHAFKNKKLAELNVMPICTRKVICQDFSKESVKDITNHGFDPTAGPTCWILEGLVMYLTEEVNIRLLTEIHNLSIERSFIILNFIDGPSSNPARIDYMDTLLKEKGWSKKQVLFYGDKDFNYGRFPEGNNPVTLGFAFYEL